MNRLRAYEVSHYARTRLTVIVAARSAKEAIEKAANHDDVIDDWAGDGAPMTRDVARRSPSFDHLAAALPEHREETGR